MRSFSLLTLVLMAVLAFPASANQTCKDRESLVVPAISATVAASLTALTMPVFTPLAAALTFGLAETIVGVDSAQITHHALWGGLGSGAVGMLVGVSALAVGALAVGLVGSALSFETNGFKRLPEQDSMGFTTAGLGFATIAFLLTPIVHAVAQGLWWGYVFPNSRANAEDRSCQ